MKFHKICYSRQYYHAVSHLMITIRVIPRNNTTIQYLPRFERSNMFYHFYAKFTHATTMPKMPRRLTINVRAKLIITVSYLAERLRDMTAYGFRHFRRLSFHRCDANSRQALVNTMAEAYLMCEAKMRLHDTHFASHHTPIRCGAMRCCGARLTAIMLTSSFTAARP